MSSKTSSYLLWDLTSCPSQSIDIVQQVIATTGLKYSSILIFADNSKDLPPSIGDLSKCR